MSLASLRHALRALLVRASLTLAAISTIGLAMGAATAIYSAVQTVLQAPLPCAEPDRLVMVGQQDVRKNAPVIELSHRKFEAFRDRSEVFASGAAVTAANIRVNLTGRGEPLQEEAALVSPEFFGTLGVPPARGRDFGPGEATDTSRSAPEFRGSVSQ
jgi:putative ABC transport system permease protein